MNGGEYIVEANHRRNPMLTDWARLSLEKESGDGVWLPKIEASRPEAALNGIAYLVAEFASLTGQQVFDVLARLAVVMLAEGAEENPSVACGDSSPAGEP